MNKKNECIKCEMSYKDPLFWDTHQTMSEGHVWCTNAKRT
jgi:hypothetical protein